MSIYISQSKKWSDLWLNIYVKWSEPSVLLSIVLLMFEQHDTSVF